MREHRFIAIAIVLASLVAACGAGDADSQPRTQNQLNQRPTTIGPATDIGPAPRDMPGGGRGSDGPHTKGKP
jgi:hypothetical protein